MKTLYKFRKIDKYAIDLLVKKRLYLASPEELNDPNEAILYVKGENVNIFGDPKRVQFLGQKINNDIVPDELLNFRICSLSNIYTSNLLWSHYADNHKGIAIGITLPEIDNNLHKIEIDYDGIVPVINNNDVLTREDILLGLTHKSKEWFYEEETRIVRFTTDQKFINDVEIKEIIFGINTPPEDIDLIKEITNIFNIQCFKIVRKTRHYQLERREVK